MTRVDYLILIVRPEFNLGLIISNIEVRKEVVENKINPTSCRKSATNGKSETIAENPCPHPKK